MDGGVRLGTPLGLRPPSCSWAPRQAPGRRAARAVAAEGGRGRPGPPARRGSAPGAPRVAPRAARGWARRWTLARVLSRRAGRSTVSRRSARRTSPHQALRLSDAKPRVEQQGIERPPVRGVAPSSAGSRRPKASDRGLGCSRSCGSRGRDTSSPASPSHQLRNAAECGQSSRLIVGPLAPGGAPPGPEVGDKPVVRSCTRQLATAREEREAPGRQHRGSLGWFLGGERSAGTWALSVGRDPGATCTSDRAAGRARGLCGCARRCSSAAGSRGRSSWHVRRAEPAGGEQLEDVAPPRA